MRCLYALGLAVAWAAGATVAAAPVPAGPTDDQLQEIALKLNDLTTLDAMNRQLRELGKDKPTAKRLVKVAAKMQEDGGKRPPLKYNAALVLATLARNQRDFAAAETLYEWCVDHAIKLQSVDKLVMSYGGLSAMLTVQRKHIAAQDAAQKILDAGFTEDSFDRETTLKLRVLEQQATMDRIRAKAGAGDHTDALEMIDTLIKQVPNDFIKMEFLELKAQVLREANQPDEAILIYQDLIKQIENLENVNEDARERMVAGMRYTLSSVFVDAKKVDQAVKILKELVKEFPDNAGYANDLGFIMADNDMELPEAERLIRKALKLDAKAKAAPRRVDPDSDDPDDAPADDEPKPTDPPRENSAYLDSLGWVLYKQGKFDEALPYLEKAAADPDDGNHIEIFDHVADVKLALGKKDEAIATWEKALKLDDISPRDAERRKAIQAKLKKAKAERDDK